MCPVELAAKKAEAALRISFARLSSATSFLNALTWADSSVVTWHPGLVMHAGEGDGDGFSAWAGALHRSVLAPLATVGVTWTRFDGASRPRRHHGPLPG